MKPLLSILFFISLSFPAFSIEIDVNKLEGLWGNSEDGGKTIWGFEHYKADGVLDSWGDYYSFKYVIKSTYQLKRDKGNLYSCIVITETSNAAIMPIGESWCDQVLKITDTEFHFKSTDGRVSVLYRQKL